jgi:hypothetical protein
MLKERLFHLSQTNLLHSLHYHDYTYSELTVPCVERVGNLLSIPENLFLDYPVITSTSRLTQIGADSHSPDSRGNRSISHNIPLTYTLNFRKTISLSRPPRPVYNNKIVTHKVYTYAGLFIRQILIGRATDFHIVKIFRVN